MIDTNLNSKCVQASHPLHGYEYNCTMDLTSSNPGWQFGTGELKNEPTDEDKNDSGNASDLNLSSPGSDNSQNLQQYRPKQNHQVSKMMLPQYPANLYTHHPSTLPSSKAHLTPKSEKHYMEKEIACASPCRKRIKENQNHLRRLEMSLEKCGIFSQSSDTKELSTKSVAKGDENLSIPKMNSHGKVKTFKCKQCDFVAFTKTEQWNHSRVHIKKDRILTCPKCSFVTEYKHHLEYHLRGHAGSKPFQCTKCEYTCVNKSMLNSHLKSHSNIYRYSCSDCSYATKYCHSLKIHLRRYGHAPNIVLDEEGNPCPDIVIDVHGTRRGPRIKTYHREEENYPISEAISLLNFPFPAYPLIPNPQILQQLIRERQALVTTVEKPDSILDLSKPGSAREKMICRKRSPIKINLSVATESDEDDEGASTTMFSNVEVIQNVEASKDGEHSEGSNNKGQENKCQFCNITFGDVVMYTLHMGQHDFKDPFTCNICKKECSDKLSFFMHGFHH